MKRLLGFALSLLLAVSIWAQRVYHGDGPDDALRFVPVASAFAFKACGVGDREQLETFGCQHGRVLRLFCRYHLGAQA